MKRFFLKTFGCRLNQAESALIGQKLRHQGWQPSPLAKANLIVVNSCAVTQKASKEVRQYLRRCRRQRPQAKIWLLGCLVDSLKQEAKPGPALPVDRFFTNQQKRQWLGAKPDVPPNPSGRVILKVQDGCNQFCSYCIVPYLRGRSQSLAADCLLEAVRQLVRQGVNWLVLSGVDLAQYHDPAHDWDFLDLVGAILRQTRLPFLSFGSLSPLLGQPPQLKRLLQLYRRYPQRLANHLHLSLQSGSNRVLRLMRRPYRRRFFLATARKLQQAIPNLNLSTDIIVGFPGESEIDFQASLDLAQKVGFGKIHIFRYSERPGTLAAKLGPGWGLLEEKTKRRRAQQLAKLELQLRQRFWRQMAQKPQRAFFFSPQQGQTSNFIPVFSQKPSPTHRWLWVKPLKVTSRGLLVTLSG